MMASAAPELDLSIEQKIQALWKTLQATNNSLATCDQLIEQYCLKVKSSRGSPTRDVGTQTSLRDPARPSYRPGGRRYRSYPNSDIDVESPRSHLTSPDGISEPGDTRLVNGEVQDTKLEDVTGDGVKDSQRQDVYLESQYRTLDSRLSSCLVLALVAGALAAPVEDKQGEKKTEKRGLLGLGSYGLTLGSSIGYSSLHLAAAPAPIAFAAPAYHAPIISAPAYHAPILSAAPAYHAPILSAPAIHAPIALSSYGLGHPW